MSEQTKTYAPVSAKAIKFERTGNSILKLSFKADAFVAWIQANTNAKGYVNLGISKRKSEGKYGETHTVWLDTWEPKPKADPPPARQPTPPEDNSVPF